MSTHLCQSCSKRPATVHLTELVDGAKRELHYCEECAQKEGVSPVSPQSFFAQLIGSGMSLEGHDADLTCTGCGLTQGEFRRRGRLGCGECYVHFRGSLKQLLEKIHGSAQHLGRIPARAGGDLRLHREIMQMKRDLARVIQREEYERAAELRDRIRVMEEQEAGGSD